MFQEAYEERIRREWEERRDAGEEDSPEYWYWMSKMGELEGGEFRRKADEHYSYWNEVYKRELLKYEINQRKNLFNETDANNMTALVSLFM